MASLKLPPLILKREHAPVLSLVPALTTSRLGAVARAWRADVAGLGTVLATVALVYWPSLTGTGIYEKCGLICAHQALMRASDWSAWLRAA